MEGEKEHAIDGFSRKNKVSTVEKQKLKFDTCDKNLWNSVNIILKVNSTTNGDAYYIKSFLC